MVQETFNGNCLISTNFSNLKINCLTKMDPSNFIRLVSNVSGPFQRIKSRSNRKSKRNTFQRYLNCQIALDIHTQTCKYKRAFAIINKIFPKI